MNSKKFAFRTIATLLCIVMLVGMIPVYVSADNEYVVEIGNVTINKATTEAVDGYYTVSVPINITTNSGLITFSADVFYDEALAITGWTENGDVFPYIEDLVSFNGTSPLESDFAKNPFRVFISHEKATKQYTDVGQLMAITFKVPEAIKAGDYPISIAIESLLWQDETNDKFPTTEKKSVTQTVPGKVTVVDTEAETVNVVFKSGEEVFATVPYTVGSQLSYPAEEPTAPSGKEFIGWDVEEGTVVPEAGLIVNAIFEDVIPDSELDYIVRGAEDWIVDVPAKFKSGGAEHSIDPETGILTISIKKAIQIDGNSRFKLELANKDIKVNDYPFVVVGYTTNETDLTEFDIAIATITGGTNNATKYHSRPKPALVEGEEIQKLVLDVKDKYTNIVQDDDTVTCYRRFEFNVTKSNGTTGGDEEFKFQYIAFFKTPEEAEAFVFGKKLTTVKFMVEGEEYKTTYAAVGSKLVYPEAPVVEGKKFAGWNVAEGAVVTSNMVVNASFASATPVTFVANGETFATLDLVEGEGLKYPETTPKATNKKFAGWDVAEGTPVTVGMKVNATFTDIEAPIGVVSGRDMRFDFKNLNSLGIFMNGKGFTGGSRLTFEANGDNYSLNAYDPEFAFDPATGVWKFVESINGGYGIDQNINVYLNLSADADYLAIGYALNSPNGVNTNGITVCTDKGDTVVPAIFDNSGKMTSLVLDLTTLPGDAKNIRYIKIMPWGGSSIAKGSYIHIAYVAAFANKVDAEAYDPMVDYVSPAQYNVTINPAENGVLWYNYDHEVTEIINDTYYAEENVYLWATPNEGYIFKGWKNGNDFIEPDATKFYWGDSSVAKSYTVTTSDTVKAAVFAVDGALDITPVFEPEVKPVKLEATATKNGAFTVNGGEAVNEYSADINPGTELTFVASANIGYKLDGWYDITNGKNILLTKEATCVYTVGEKDAQIEVRFMDEAITIPTKLAVETDGNGKVSVAGGQAVNSYFNYANGGDDVTLKAVANEGYVFAYWTRKTSDGTEVFIDAEAEIEVAPLGAEVAYVANFVAEGETATLYVDSQEIVLSKTEKPEIPGRLGYVAGEWKEIITLDNVIIHKPTYVRAETTCTLTIKYADMSVETVSFKYEEYIQVTGKADSSVWTLTLGDGEPTVFSYKNQFAFGASFTTDATLVETENDEVAKAIVNALSAEYDAGAKQIKFTASFELPEGATLVERGVLLTSDAEIANDMRIGDDVIEGKIMAPAATATKVFIINKSNVAEGSTWYGRPYIIYTVNGVTETLYTATISATAE